MAREVAREEVARDDNANRRARRIAHDLAGPPLSRARVLATVVRLLETTSIRVGNEEYVRANGSYGLTTLQDRHVRVRGSKIQFRFRAKSGVLQTIGDLWWLVVPASGIALGLLNGLIGLLAGGLMAGMFNRFSGGLLLEVGTVEEPERRESSRRAG